MTTGLTNELTFAVNLLTDGLSISNLRVTYYTVNLELAKHTVNDDLQVKLTHTGDDNLTSFFISTNAEGWILLSQLLKGNTHLLLVVLGLRLNCYGNNWIWELHGLQNDWCILITEGITSSGVLKAYCSSDITTVYNLQFLTVICMHLENTADTLLLALGGIVHIRAGGKGTGVNSEECQLTNEWVSHNLECQCSKWLLIA